MSGIRPQEVIDVLRRLDEEALAGRPAVLMTVVALEGSVFPRSGLPALVSLEGPAREGFIALEELPLELGRRVREAAQRSKPLLCGVDLAEDEPLLSHGLGAPGRVEFFLEPVDGILRGRLRPLREALLKSEGLVYSLEIEGPGLGERAFYSPEQEQARECYKEMSPELVESAVEGRVCRRFLCPLSPMGKALVFGSGADAAALACRLDELGFLVWAADPRPGRLRGPRWERAHCQRIEGGWREARQAAAVDEETAVVVLTHSFALDLETLQGALASPAFYVGLTGPARRTQRLLSELSALETRPRPGVLRAPAGLDLGEQAPAETALSIAAEILALRSGRRVARRGERPRSASIPAKPKVPGLILAAGPGKRFEGGSKLGASFGGRAVLRHVVDNALGSRLDPVIVVLGSQAEEGLRALQGVQDPRLRVVFNPLWEGGKASSLDVGLREVPFPAPGFLLLLGDMPLVESWLIDRVLTEFELSGRLVFPVYEGPQGPVRGHPTAFPRSFFGEVRALTGDETVMDAIREHWSEAVKIPLEDARTQADVDTPRDLELLRGD